MSDVRRWKTTYAFTVIILGALLQWGNLTVSFLHRAENTKSNNLLFVWFFVIAHYAVVAAGAQTDEYSQLSKFYKHWCLETYCSDNVESTED